MANINRVVLSGRLTHDPECRMTEHGILVTRFSLAVNRPTNNGKSQVDYIDCVAWRGLAQVCRDFLEKGKLVVLEGRLQIRHYEGDHGARRRSTEVIVDRLQMLDRKFSEKEEAATQPEAESVEPAPEGVEAAPEEELIEA